MKLKDLIEQFPNKLHVEVKTGDLKLKDIIFSFKELVKVRLVFVKDEDGHLIMDNDREPITGTLEEMYHNKEADVFNMDVKHVANLIYYDGFFGEECRYLTFFLEDRGKQLKDDKKER